MSISTQRLYDLCVNKFGGQAGDRLKPLFIEAVNNVQRDLTLRSHVSGLTSVTSEATDIAVDADYEGVVLSGIFYYLQRDYEWASDDERDYQAEYYAGLRLVQGQYFVDATDNEVYARLGDLS